MIYVLAQLIHRAETTDTSLICAAYNRADLEELVLSLYEEIIDNYGDYDFADYYVSKFKIVRVAIL